MHIEDKITLSELADRSINGASRGAIPTSHICWVMYCLLRGAGAQITPDQVWLSIRSNETDVEQLSKVIQFVISEVYGTGPQDPEDIETDKKK